MNADELYAEILKVTTEKQISHWQSDLYCKVTSKTANLVRQYEYKNNVTTFTENTNHELWYEIPFAYIPYWEDKCAREF